MNAHPKTMGLTMPGTPEMRAFNAPCDGCDRTHCREDRGYWVVTTPKARHTFYFHSVTCLLRWVRRKGWMTSREAKGMLPAIED